MNVAHSPQAEPRQEFAISHAQRLRDDADAIIDKNTIWALSLGLVPLPVVDLFTLFAVQLKLLRELAQLYNVDFSERIARNLVRSLLLSSGGVSLAVIGGVSVSKFIPFISSVSMSAIGGAITYATGRVFAEHFCDGGTFLDFDPLKLRGRFDESLRAGRARVRDLRRT